jgi:hypothetical protein
LSFQLKALGVTNVVWRKGYETGSLYKDVIQSVAIWTTSVLHYDPLGRVLESQQTSGGGIRIRFSYTCHLLDPGVRSP